MNSDRRRPPQGPSESDPEILERLDEIWDSLEEGEPESALELAGAAVAEFPGVGDLQLALAAALYETGASRLTLEAARRAGELGTDNEPLQRWYVAAAHHYLWEFETARNLLEPLTREVPDYSESWYLLAQVCEMQGDEVGARRGYEVAFSLEPDRFPRPHRIDDVQMHEAIERARGELPPRFRELLGELAVVIEDLPSAEMAKAEADDEEPLPPDLLGLYVGTDRFEHSTFNPVDSPGVILLFKRNLERACPDRTTLIQEIRITLWHELAHYLGFEEEDMANLGLE